MRAKCAIRATVALSSDILYQLRFEGRRKVAPGMAIRNLADLKALMPKGGRLAGLDLGEKTIGVAVSDPLFAVASPVGTVRRTKFTADVTELARLLRDRTVRGFVLGLPVNMDGTEGPAAQSVRSFAHNLIGRADLFEAEPEIVFWDERLSTVAVNRMLIREADATRRQRGKVVDQSAAAYILQGALDALRNLPG
jgi:putative Holliday junction resolvase